MSDGPDPLEPQDAGVVRDGDGDNDVDGGADLMRRVANELHQRRGADAVRLFLEGHAQGQVPAYDGLLQWIVDRIGQDDARRLVRAFAHFPCMACHGGLEPCALCDGDGVREDDDICETCIGSGRVRCDFCAGSGLATYNLIPVPLRLNVIAHRVNMAQREVEKLDPSNLPAQPNVLLNLVLSANKLWCVFENAYTSARALAAEHPNSAGTVQPLLGICRGGDEKLEAFARAALRTLAQNLSEPADASAVGGKSDYYRTLAEAPTFERTLLHHPLLRPAREGD